MIPIGGKETTGGGEDIRLAVCDLDGTLLNSGSRVTPYTVRVLRRARERGVRICFASGRIHQMMEVYAAVTGGCDYLLSSNGALVRDGRTGGVIHKELMPPEGARAMLGALRERGIPFVAYKPHAILHTGSERITRRFAAYEALTRELGYPQRLNTTRWEDDMTEAAAIGVIKLVAYDEEARLRELAARVSETAGLTCESTGYGLLGIFAGAVSKETGLRAVMERMQIDEQQVCVFGDYANDLSMFACAAHRIAMANAQESLKAAATAIAPSNDEDGVARWLAEKLGLED